MNNFVYKKCGEYVVIMQYTENTVTNESTYIKDVINPNYAEFSGSEFLVVDIEHMYTKESIKSIENTIYTYTTITYKSGKVIRANNFYTFLDSICSTGIHYFRSYDAAYWYDFKVSENWGLFLYPSWPTLFLAIRSSYV